MRAKDVMSRGVMSVSAEATVFEATELLVNTGVSAMPVLDDSGYMIGIVSEADLIRSQQGEGSPVASGLLRQFAEDAAAAYVQGHSRRVAEVMSKAVISADETASLEEVGKLMLSHRIKRVPVLRGRSVVGMLSRADLLRALISRNPAGDVVQPESSVRQSGDDQLRGRVTAAVEGHRWSVAQRADVVVSGGTVHLWGVAPSEVVRKAYRVAAENVPGVRGVEMHMHVVPSSARIDA